MILLHIGTHKTGSSSLQHYLGSNRGALNSAGVAFYTGAFQPDNHIELYLSALESGKDTLAQKSLSLPPINEMQSATRASVAEFLEQNQGKFSIFSCEGLSLLRSPSELNALCNLLGRPRQEVRIVLCLRDKSDFLASYRKQIFKVPGRKPSSDVTSALYVEADSWLADFEQLKAAYMMQFGNGCMTIVDYDRSMQLHGDVMPDLLHALMIPGDLVLPAGAYDQKNTRTLGSVLKQKTYRAIKSLGFRG